MLSNILDRISFWSLFLVIVLLPVFFLPFTQIPIETSKGLLLVVGLIVSIIFWIAARFSDGKIVLPKSWLLLSGFVLLLVTLISALFSSTVQVSLFGTLFDIGTFYFLLGAFLLMLFSSIILRDTKNAKMVFLGVVVSSAVLFVFQIVHVFLPSLLSMGGVLIEKTDSILGSWNALGLFAGFSAILSLFIIEFFSVSRLLKLLLGILIVFSLLLSILVNFLLVWELLGIFALIIFVYNISLSFGKEEENNKRHFPGFSFAIVMVSLLFFMSGQYIGGYIPNKLGLSNNEISPSFMTTMQVTKDALMKNPVLGPGPNKFNEIWSMYKPQAINSTIFWDTPFNSGSGLLPTFASTNGSLGILSWLVFLVLFIITGARALFYSIKSNTNWEIVVFFVASLYLLVSSFFYSTGSVIFLLAFAFIGMFIGLSSSKSKDEEFTFSFLDDPRKSFFSILVLVVLMIVSAATGFKYIEKLASVSYFGKTLSAPTIPIAESSIIKALSLHQNDLYLRTYSQVYLTKINSMVSKGASTLSDADKAELQASFEQAVAGAQNAIAYDSTNYLNYNSLGVVYNTVGLLGVKDAYNKSIESYKSASILNPFNPGIKLALGRVSFANGKTSDARNYVKEALTLKPDYVDALVAISQIEKNDGNNALAISYAESALSFDPQNKDLVQYVSSLKNGSTPVPPPSTTSSSTTTNNTKKIK